LVNNAGSWFSDRRASDDGHELTLATNVLGPHLLTKLLAPLLRAGAPSRVVNVVSSLASDYDASDLQFERRKYDGFKVYAQSKLALRMLTWAQAAAFEGSGVTANAAAPGFVKTNLNQHASGFTAAMIKVMSSLFAQSPAKGADTPLWAATATELAQASGKYFADRKESDGKYHDPAAIAELVARCDSLISSSSPRESLAAAR
jgi:NAD(P)-dependent dehydrogenase (short-subunit alcohol dehydrogenase family)